VFAHFFVPIHPQRDQFQNSPTDRKGKNDE